MAFQLAALDGGSFGIKSYAQTRGCPLNSVDRTTALPYEPVLRSVVETSIFSRRADALLTALDRARLVNLLAVNPEGGDLIGGLGGIRKLRFAPAGRGKQEAVRVIYYLASARLPVLALLIYGKNEQDDAVIDVKEIRGRLGLSQVAFARRFKFSVATLREWEQGRRRPEQAARILLQVIAQRPDVVDEVLATTKRQAA